jgi:hypothetical protein
VLAGGAIEAPQGRKAGKQIGRAATLVFEGLNGRSGSIGLTSSGGIAPEKQRQLSSLRGEISAGMEASEDSVGIIPTQAYRTAVCVIRLYGGVTGKAREGLPMSIRHIEKERINARSKNIRKRHGIW